MNKKALVRFSLGMLFSCAIIFLFVLVVNSNFTRAEVQGEVYSLGQNVKIDLSEFVNSENLRIKIKTPSTEYLVRNNGDELVFKPEEIGQYNVVLSSEDVSKEIGFDVVDSEILESNNVSNEEVDLNKSESSTYKEPENSIQNNIPIIERNDSDNLIIINRPVDWKERINSSLTDGKIRVPKLAENISLFEIKNGERVRKEFEFSEKSLLSYVLNIFSNDENYQFLNTNKSDNELEITYNLPAPVASEIEISENKKNVKIYSPEGTDYLNVLAYTNVSEKIGLDEKDRISIYWKEENRYLDFNAFDLNNNGLVDYIEWTVPHLSEQNFEIILINKAEHLDENKTFVSDVYSQVKEKDSNFTNIPLNHYLRVSFENNLSSKNDITIYAKSNSIARVEVYPKDSNQKIAEFSNINQEDKYKILLTGINGSYGSFDLKVLDADVEFDYVVDPVTSYLSILNFTNNTSNTAYWGQPTSSNRFLAGTQATGTQYTNMATNNGVYASVTAAGTNDFPFWRLNFTIAPNASDINWIHIFFNGYEDGNTEVATIFIWNYTSSAWTTFGTVPAADGNVIVNYTSGISGLIGSAKQLILAIEGNSFDVGDDIFIDDIEVSISYNVSTNDAPNTPSPSINSSDGSNNSLSNLNCFATITDLNNNTMNVTTRWYKQGVLNLSLDYNNSYSNGTLFNAILNYGNLSLGTNWSCAIRTYDGLNYSSFGNSTNLTIRALPKPQINIISPLAQNYSSIISHFNVSLNQPGSWCGFSLDGSSNRTMTGFNITYFNYTNSSMSQGNHNIVFSCNNTEGNMNSTSIRYFGIDTISPSISLISPVNGYNYSILPISFNISTNEVSFAQYTLNNGVTNITMGANSSFTGFNASNGTLADGNYLVRFYVNDSAGNINYSISSNFTIDRTNPLVTIVSPLNITYNITSTIYFNFTLNEAGTCNYTLNNGVTNITMGANSSFTGFNASNGSISQGNYTVRAYCKDLFGNNNFTTSLNFTMLYPAPLIQNTSCFDGSSWTSCSNIGWANSIYLKTNCTSQIGGSANNVTFRLTNIDDNKLYFNQTILSQTAGYFEYNSGLLINDSGNFNLHITCRENPTSEEDLNWSVAFGNLSVNLINPSANTSVGKARFFNFSAEVVCTGGECGNVNATLDPISYVRSGGVTATSFSFDIDTPDNRLVVIFAGDESAGTNLTGASVDGKACTRVAVADNALSGSNHQEMWYCDDDQLGSSNQNVTVAITGGDASWAIHAHLYTGVSQNGPVSFGVNQTAVGGTTISVRNISTSRYGLVVAGFGEGNGGFTLNSQTSPLTTRQDGPDPTSADLFTSSGVESSDQFNKTYTATLSAAMNRGTGIAASWDSAGGVKGIIPMNSGTPFYTTSLNPMNYSSTGCLNSMVNGSSCNVTWVVNATGSANSTWEFFAYANSTSYLNVTSGVSSHINITILEVDLDPPRIFNITPTINSYAFNPVNLSALTNENAYCQYSNSFTFSYGTGTDFTTGQGTTSHSVNLGNLSDGVYAYYIKCNDSSGNNNTNVNQNSTTFTVDSLNPLVTIVSPQNDWYNTSTIYFNFTINEAGNCTYSLNGGLNNRSMSTNFAQTDFNASNSTLANGQYNLSIYCNDSAGNRNYTMNQTFYKDTVAPNATLISPSNGNISNNTVQNLTANITDNLGISNVTLSIWNQTGLVNQTTYIINGGTQALVGIVYNFLYDGVFTWFYRVVDFAGNQFTSTNRTITIDASAPNIIVNYPINGTTIADVTPNLNVTLDDNVSSLWYSIDGGATNNTICNNCGSVQTKFLYFNESNITVTIYANNSFGVLSSNSTSFRVFMNYGYFDTFGDNSSVLLKSNGVSLQTGNISFYKVLGNPFWDDFEGTLAKWDGNGATAWDLSATYNHSSGQGVRANNGNEGDFTSDDIDLTGVTKINLSFWCYPIALEDADVDVYFFNGASYVLVDNIGADGVQNQWNKLELEITDSQYFVSNFRLRINANMGAGETFGLDDLNISTTSTNGDRANFTSYAINTTEPIMEFRTISWGESGTNFEDNLSVQVSPNNGTTWYNATNGNGIYGIQNGSSLIYRVFSSTTSTNQIYLLDMNITWSNSTSSAPRININYPTNGTTIADVTPNLNVTLSSNANTLWYTLNNGSTNTTICNDCSGVRTRYLYLKEGNFTVRVYANNSLGSVSSNSSYFNISMNYNYFDTYFDNSSALYASEGVYWQAGNISFAPSSSNDFSDDFEGTLAKWNDNGATAWDLNTTYNYSSVQSVRADNGNEGDLTSDNIDTSEAARVKISFRYYPVALEDADADIILYNGFTFTTIDNFGADNPQNQWNYKEYNITASQYFISNFRLRFNANMGAGEVLAIDNVVVTIYNSATDYGSSGNYTSYSINVTQPIVEILNVTWNQSGINSSNPNKNLTLKISPNNGSNWYNATNGNGIYGITSGTNLTYRVFFGSNDSREISLLDLNITWTDKIYPRVNIIYPVSNTFYLVNVSELNYTVSDSLGAESCWYSNSSGRWNSTVVSAGANFTNITSREGNNTWTVYCNNTAGNTRGASVFFTKDTVSPNGTLISPLNNSFVNNVTQNMSVNATDLTGLSNVTLFVYNSSNSLINQTTRVLSGGTQALVGIVYNFLYDGVFTWFYRIVDIGNNQFTTINNTITLDRVAPNVSIIYPLSILYSTDVSELNYTYNDSNPAYCWYSLNSGATNLSIQTPSLNWSGLNSSEGSNIWTVYCNDSANNLKTTTVSFFKDTLNNPGINFTSPTYPSGVFTRNTSISINISISELNLSSLTYNWNETNFTLYNRSLIAMYNFDNRSSLSESHTSNITYDSSLNRNDARCSGMGAGCNYTAGKYGKSIYFGGTNDYVNISGINSTSKSYTISMWAKSTSNSVQMNLLDSQSGRMVLAWRADTPNLGFFDTSWKYFGATPNDGNWHHLTLVLDNSSTSATMYLDGVQSGLTGVYSSNLNLTSNTILGARYAVDTNFFIGSMDEVRIFDRALSSNEVYEMYASNLQKFDVIQWYLYINQSKSAASRLDDGFYTYYSHVQDLSGNQNQTEKRNLTIDTIKPIINITYPLNITYIINVSELNYTHFDINSGSCWYSNSSGRWNSTIVSAGINFTDVISREGQNNWTIYCNDSANNLNFTNVTFIKDMLPPNGTLISPLNNTFTNNLTQNMSVNATDIVGLSNATLFIYNSSNSLINQTTRVISGGTQALVGIVYNFLYDGVFTWFYRIVDIGNYEFTTVNNTITIDRTSPMVEILSPLNITYGSGSAILFNFALNEAGNCTYSLNGGLNNRTMFTNSSRTGFNATNATLPDGNYLVNAYCNDSAGNRNYSVSQTFSVNTTAPRVTIISPINGQNYSNSTIHFNVTLDEDGNICRFTLDNWQTNYSMSQFNSTYFNYTNISVNDGNYLARFWCNDSLNNANSTSTVNFSVDTLYPQIAFGNRTAIDNANLSQNWLYVNVSLVESNLRNITYILYNDSGIVNSSTFVNRTLYFNFTSLSQGYYTYNVTAIDIINQRNTTLTNRVLLDTAAPNGTLISPENATITNITLQNFTVNASDNFAINNATLFIYNSANSLINQTTQVLTGGTQALVGVVYNFLFDGVFTWFYRIVDFAGNQFTTINNTITIDTSAPRLNITYPLNKSYNFDITELNYTLSELTPNSCWYILNGNAPVFITCGQNVTGLTSQEGQNNWTVYANDTFGYLNSSSVLFIKDTVNPLVSILSPLNLTYGNSPIIFNFTLNEAGTCVYSLNAGAVNYTMTANSSRTGFTASNSTIADGSHTVNAYCNDSAGNKNYSLSQTFSRDATAPGVNIVSPINGQNYSNSTIHFNVTLNEDGNICRLTLNNWQTNYSMSQFNSTYFNYTNISVNDGNYLARFWCNDSLNNANSTSTVNFSVDTLYPQISYGIGTAADGANLSQTFVYINVSLVEANLMNITYTLLNDTGIVNQTTFFSAITQITFLSLPQGNYTYNVTAVDILNQRNTTARNLVLLDTAAPNGTLISPENATITNITLQNFTVNASDNFAIRNVTLFVYNSSNSLINQTTQVLTGGTQALVGVVYNFLYDGVFTWFYRIVDFSGNQFTTTNSTITVDTRAPIVYLNITNNTFFRTNTVLLNYTPLDAVSIKECRLYINGNQNMTNQSNVLTNQLNNFTLNLANGNYEWYVLCSDLMNYTNQSENRTFNVDSSFPTVSLLAPLNNTNVLRNNQFNFTATDNMDINLSCNFYIDNTLNRTNINASNGSITSLSILRIPVGTHSWNVSCRDDANNTNYSESLLFNVTLPDLMVNSSSIYLNSSSPKENETINITATIYNLQNISITNVTVQIYLGNPSSGGILLGGNQTISLNGLSKANVSVNWNTNIGANAIFVIVDPPLSTNGSIEESNESNNQANLTLNVDSWHYVYGYINSESEFQLADNDSNSVIKWSNTNFTSGNIYVTDYESQIAWSSLRAIGKNITGQNTTNDFTEIDMLLNMTGFSDSLSNTFLNSSGQIKNTSTYKIFNRNVLQTPVVNSINNSNFITGILWDSSDNLNAEYDSSDKEDLVFVTRINPNQVGAYGTYDYEIRIPAKLKVYKTNQVSGVAFYTEIY